MSSCKFLGASMLSVVLFHTVTAFCAPPESVMDLSGKDRDPFAKPAKARVFLFVRTDCPITNRYAPELARIAREFADRDTEFWLVYADPREEPAKIRRQRRFGFLKRTRTKRGRMTLSRRRRKGRKRLSV